MTAAQSDIHEVLATLRRTPLRLAELADGCTAEQLRARPAPEEWSAAEIVAHLRACADVWGGSIARILDEDTPTFRYLSPRTYIRKTDYLTWAFEAGLAAFTAQRAALIARLKPRPPEAWQRTANVTKSGKPRVETVLSYVAGMASHELAHLDQLTGLIESVRDR